MLKKYFRRIPLTPLQLIIISGMGMILCLICMGTGVILSLSDEQLFGNSVAADYTPPEPSPLPSNTPTPTKTPTKIPLPEATSDLKPTPTATYAVAPELINQDKIQEIITYVEQVRGLSISGELPTHFLTRRQLREQWQKTSFDRNVIEALKTQQEFYVALGLIQPGVDLIQKAAESQNNILLGYYTPEEKRMYIISESVNMFAQEEMTFAHEYTHALQDYHFDLNRILGQENSSADFQLAARSLPEGDASLVERFFTYDNITQDQLEYNVYRYLFQEPPQMEGVSPALGIFTHFPYTAGEYFVTYLFLEGGGSWALINEAYHHPPLSTEQVMHPEKYLAGEEPIPVPMPDITPQLEGTWHELDRDTLGELGFLVWLVDQLEATTAIKASAGWDGDSYSLWVDGAGHRLLVELSVWESPTEATEFFEAFDAYMSLRESQALPYQEVDIRLWEYEGGVTLLRRNQNRILILIAPDRPTFDSVVGRLNNF